MKKLFSFALATALCLAMLPTAALADSSPVAPAAGEEKYSITIHAGDTSGVDLGAKSFQVRNWNEAENDGGLNRFTKTEVETLALDRVYALPMGSKLVIESEDGIISDMAMRFQVWSDPDGDGVYDSLIARIVNDDYEVGDDYVYRWDTELMPVDTAGPLQETFEARGNGEGDGTWISYEFFGGVYSDGTIYFYTEGFGLIEGTAEVYTNYLVSEFGPNTLFQLSFHNGFAEAPSTSHGGNFSGNSIPLYSDYYFLLTGEPDAPRTAVPTSSTVTVNGVPTAFDAYNIDGNNYFKLRDVAYVLNGTEKQFGVDWDAAANSITLLYDTPYTPVGGEMTPGTGTAQTAVSTSSDVLMYGTVQALEAYNIGGNNYFKLRDLGRMFSFGVDWDAANNTVVIDTSKHYYN